MIANHAKTTTKNAAMPRNTEHDEVRDRERIHLTSGSQRFRPLLRVRVWQSNMTL